MDGAKDGTRPLRVLITADSLAEPFAGSMYVHDLARGLLARGHQPVVYSPVLGAVAEQLRRARVPVTDQFDALGNPPDLIQGHSVGELMTALLHFSETRALFFWDGADPWIDLPPRIPRIGCYAVLDAACGERLIGEAGVPQHQVRLLPAFVDAGRFLPRPALPRRPARALLWTEPVNDGDPAPVLAEACRGVGANLEFMRPRKVVGEIEECLTRCDLVFASGRSALEAMAAGAGVILCDGVALGPLVTTTEFDSLHRQNFGSRALRLPLRHDEVLRQIDRYNADDAAMVTKRVRSAAGQDAALDQLLPIYRQVLEAPLDQSRSSALVESRALAAYVRSLAPHVQERAAAPLRRECEQLRNQRDHARAERDGLRTERDDVLKERDGVQQLHDYFKFEYDLIKPERDHFLRECERLRGEQMRLEKGVAELSEKCALLVSAVEQARNTELQLKQTARERDDQLKQSARERDELRQEWSRLDAELRAVYASLAVRARDRLLKTPVLGSATRLAARRMRTLKQWVTGSKRR